MPKKNCVNCAKDAISLAKKLITDDYKEHLIGIYLDARNRVNEIELISFGSIEKNVIHPREIFRPAIIYRACYIIILHNHPSENPEPTGDDEEITEMLKHGGDILGVPIIDHIIFTKSGKYYSFNDQHSGFNKVDI